MPGRLNPETVHCSADAEAAIMSYGLTVSQLVDRHANGDWGTFNDQDAATVIESPVRDRAALLAMFDFGLRATEVCRISHTDIDWNASTVTITDQAHTRPPELQKLLSKVSKPQSTASRPPGGPIARSYEASPDIKSALVAWRAQSPSDSGPMFTNLEATYLRNLMKAAQSSFAVANEIALLLRRGTVHSLFVFDPAPVLGNLLQRLVSRPRRLEKFAVLIRTWLDSSQSQVDAPVDGQTMLGLHLKLSPTLMFGTNRQPFQCSNTVIVAPDIH